MKDDADSKGRYDKIHIAIIGMQSVGVRTILDRVGPHSQTRTRVHVHWIDVGATSKAVSRLELTMFANSIRARMANRNNFPTTSRGREFRSSGIHFLYAMKRITKAVTSARMRATGSGLDTALWAPALRVCWCTPAVTRRPFNNCRSCGMVSAIAGKGQISPATCGWCTTRPTCKEPTRRYRCRKEQSSARISGQASSKCPARRAMVLRDSVIQSHEEYSRTDRNDRLLSSQSQSGPKLSIKWSMKSVLMESHSLSLCCHRNNPCIFWSTHACWSSLDKFRWPWDGLSWGEDSA